MKFLEFKITKFIKPDSNKYFTIWVHRFHLSQGTFQTNKTILLNDLLSLRAVPNSKQINLNKKPINQNTKSCVRLGAIENMLNGGINVIAKSKLFREPHRTRLQCVFFIIIAVIFCVLTKGKAYAVVHVAPRGHDAHTNSCLARTHRERATFVIDTCLEN